MYKVAKRVFITPDWKNESAFRGWVGSDDFKLAHANPMPQEAFDGEGKLEQFDVIIDTQG
ncbi:MAG: hypothetical protein GY694_14520 [Gammaproteobacteria bacterium]|nr:hypothetical protein [Gammaproteobacteria bacterium]